MGSNREKFNIAIAILENIINDQCKTSKQMQFYIYIFDHDEHILYTVGENIIGAPKMRNNFWVP